MATISFLAFLSVYDVLTGKIVYTVKGHKDIVRDVAWHPSRKEILTSSWDRTINLNWRGQKPRVQKRSFREMNRDDGSLNDDENTDSSLLPPRRSKRLAMRRMAQQLN